ncbi:Probable RNA-directed DNA polymerase from transposon BS [Eumeta japonica]|uniref:Probable RNA-directed DNA polymerase from transposon BS n=1 Tax=Eumeta variegata TaxID=151549 RepID=A0A4C2AD38_EUMVA|nr:Probable RNA-directed DNA polymerase from transposon BS [Eumeta japonica]
MPATGIAISAVYCPPRHNINKEQFTNYFKTLGSKFVSAGDFNAKHTYWGSRLITPRGRQLLETVMSNNLDAVSSGHPTYWPTDLNKIPDVIDFADNFSNPLKDRLPVLKAVIKNLNPKKSPGRDKITNTMIVNLPSVALKTILFIFNSMLRTGYFPSTWKQSEIVMISKPGKDVTQSKDSQLASLRVVYLGHFYIYCTLQICLQIHLRTHPHLLMIQHFLSIHKHPEVASQQLQTHIADLEKWLHKWKINVNASKSVHITFTLRQKNCPPISINGVTIPEQRQVRYLGIHLDRRLTWTHHIAAKITQLKIRTSQLYWLMGSHSSLSLDHKVLLYKAALKPIWLYGIQLWGSASASNVEKLQRRQSKILRLITCAPWYIRNNNIHKDLNITTIREEIKKSCTSYTAKVTDHPNPFARDLLLFEGHRRLKRVHTF